MKDKLKKIRRSNAKYKVIDSLDNLERIRVVWGKELTSVSEEWATFKGRASNYWSASQ